MPNQGHALVKINAAAQMSDLIIEGPFAGCDASSEHNLAISATRHNKNVQLLSRE